MEEFPEDQDTFNFRIDYNFIGPQYKDTFVESKWFYFSAETFTDSEVGPNQRKFQVPSTGALSLKKNILFNIVHKLVISST